MVILGIKKYGRIIGRDGSLEATVFFHLFFLPLVPVQGVRFKGDRPMPSGRLNPVSVIAAYVRVWGLLAVAALLVHAYDELENSLGAGGVWFGVALAAALGVAASWLMLGTLARKTVALGLAATAVAVGLVAMPALRGYQQRHPVDGTALLRSAAEAAHEQQTAGLLEQCNANDLSACEALARTNRNDLRLATLGYTKACEGKRVKACMNLAIIAEQAQDQALAERWWHVACGLDDGFSCNQEAERLAKTRALDAIVLFDKGCTLGSKDACRNLGKTLSTGPGKKKNTRRASAAYQRACELGDPTSCRG